MKLKNFNKKIKAAVKGFTLVETLVAISLLVLSVTGPMAIAQTGLRAAFLSRDQTTAFYLAQDAIEYVKNVRDDNIIRSVTGDVPDNWLDGLEDCIDTLNGCSIDTTTEAGSVFACPGANGCENNPLLYDSVTGQFNTQEGTDSPFTREIFITDVVTGANREAEITVIMKWTSPVIGERVITVQENIFNWFDL